MCFFCGRGIRLVLALVPGLGWSGVREDFEELTGKYLTEVEGETEVLSRVFVREIRVLEDRALEEGDFATAIRCRDRRRELENEEGSVQGSPPDVEERVSGPVGADWVFVPADCEVGGFTKKGGLLSIDTSESVARIEWKMNGVPPGGYRVEIELTGTGKAVARLEEAHFFVVKTLSEFATVDLGNLKITRGSGPLVLTFEQLSVGNSLEVRQVKLISNAPR